MTDQEILTKAIQTAVENKWNYNDIDLELKKVGSITVLNGVVYLYEGEPLHSKAINSYSLFEIIYNHDFAKAIFGEKVHDADVGTYDVEWNPCSHCGGDDFHIDFCWEYYLMQMVIATSPIQYLAKALEV